MNIRTNFYERGRSWYFHLWWYENGERQQDKKGGFPSKRAAMVAAKQRIGELEACGGKPSDDTVGGHVPVFLGSLRVAGRSEPTIASYREKLESYVLPRFGDVKLADLTVQMLDRMYAELLEAGGKRGQPLSARTVAYTHAIVRKMLGDAHRKGLIPSNPATRATAPSPSAARAAERQTWTPAELAGFLVEVADDYYAPLWHTIAFTGLRRSEVLGLRWSDVDIDGRMLYVTETLVQIGKEVQTGKGKSKNAARAVDLDDTTSAVLRGWKKRQTEHRLLVGAGWRDSGRVFTAPHGAALLPETVSRAWRRIVRSSTLPRITLHDLRHTHATHLLIAGRNHREIADRLGHDDAGFTLRTYTHTQPGAQRAGAQAVAELVARAAVTNPATTAARSDALDAS